MSFSGINLKLEPALNRAVQLATNGVQIVGLGSNLPLAALLASRADEIETQPAQVLLFSSSVELNQFVEMLEFFEFSKKVHILPSFDVSPYSGLYPNTRDLAQRINWLFHAQSGRGLFLATVSSITQKTLPLELLADLSFEWLANQELPEDFTSQLEKIGYQNVPTVSEVGQYAMRGGILDIFSPMDENPIRLELFGDTIDSMRFFDPESQRSLDSTEKICIAPPRELVFSEERLQHFFETLATDFETRGIEPSEREDVLRSLRLGHYFQGIDFLLGEYYEKTSSPLDHFLDPFHLWLVDELECSRQLDILQSQIKKEFQLNQEQLICPRPQKLFSFDEPTALNSKLALKVSCSRINLSEGEELNQSTIDYKSGKIQWNTKTPSRVKEIDAVRLERLEALEKEGYKIAIVSANASQRERLKLLFAKTSFSIQEYSGSPIVWSDLYQMNEKKIALIEGYLPESSFLTSENLVFLRDEDFLGYHRHRKAPASSDQKEFQNKASALSFADLKEGDLIVHTEHGVGVYEGLEIMDVGGAASEFIKLSYKDNDRLFIPIYRIGQIQKYGGPTSQRILDKLGGNQWKAVKTKVSKRLKDIASELLQLYAKRAELKRPPFLAGGDDFFAFENAFPYEETPDQIKTIDAVLTDMTSEQPMDRLVCGDVGFGKTEIAMRAAFKAVESKKQVAVLAPTTVLTFQHFENFKKRFKDWPIEIRSLNRFVAKAEVKKTLKDLSEGTVDIVIGTHRLLSKDIQFDRLGLLIIDEEQKFGVTHKEKIRQLKTSVDTLTLSATPIPRTLNMSLMNIRDLSLINTAPIDRLPTRTFVCKPNQETIRKAIDAELSRGGQVFYLHNRVQSIYGVVDELREWMPSVRFAVAHGQMEEGELEKVMMAFLKHEIDVLVCTTIIESGVDISRANTMFIDRANTFGLSQLYQLRGRVGRSKDRAYCYLLLPPSGKIDPQAQERLKIIQENTALGSGIRIAQYDLELRGSGNILGEDQSGHINAVGYEMYAQLLEEAVREAKGEEAKLSVDPEINIRIPAFIPDNYIQDLRMRLSYYKMLSQIDSPEDLDKIEDELRDQFGKLPEPAVNLMGTMLIRLQCKNLGIRDLSTGPKSVALAFTENTPLPAQEVIKLTTMPNKKYSFTPDNRLRIRMNDVRWPLIFDELSYLEKLSEKK